MSYGLFKNAFLFIIVVLVSQWNRILLQFKKFSIWINIYIQIHSLIIYHDYNILNLVTTVHCTYIPYILHLVTIYLCKTNKVNVQLAL